MRRTAFHSTERRNPTALLVATLVSVVGHAIGAVVLAQFRLPEPGPVPDRVLQVQFISRGTDDGDQEPAAEPAVEPATVPAPVRPAAVAPVPQPVEPVPQPSAPAPPQIEFPALYATAQHRPREPVDLLAPPQSFAAWQQRRTARAVPSHLRIKGGGSVDGTASVDSEGVDRCQPADGRVIQRLYLLFDSSGSMSSELRNQALSCAQQYARAVIDAGGEVVVGNFARSASFEPATRNPTDVAFALRADNDSRATVRPSRDLNPFFDEAPGVEADLVILSDGMIPNYREVLPWYTYFLDLNAGNRGYLYTLGTRGPPEVTSALRRIGFEIRVYRTL